jgi:lysophospholipase L1-like esterase
MVAMRKLIISCAVATVVVLTILTGSGAVQAEPILIAVIGDSNVQGRGVEPSDAYPSKLEKALVAKGYDIRMQNSGANGDTTQGVLARLDSAAPQGTKIAIVWVGINDLRRGVPGATVAAGRQEIATRLKARGIQVLTFNSDPAANLRSNPQFTVGDQQHHLNAAGYDLVVARTLPQIEGMVRRAGGKHR